VGPNRRVVGAATLPLCGQAPCPTTYAPEPVAYVLELGAGRFAGKTGDEVVWECDSAAGESNRRQGSTE
jgi:hypothetical protein